MPRHEIDRVRSGHLRRIAAGVTVVEEDRASIGIADRHLIGVGIDYHAMQAGIPISHRTRRRDISPCRRGLSLRTRCIGVRSQGNTSPALLRLSPRRHGHGQFRRVGAAVIFIRVITGDAGLRPQMKNGAKNRRCAVEKQIDASPNEQKGSTNAHQPSSLLRHRHFNSQSSSSADCKPQSRIEPQVLRTAFVTGCALTGAPPSQPEGGFF